MIFQNSDVFSFHALRAGPICLAFLFSSCLRWSRTAGWDVTNYTGAFFNQSFGHRTFPMDLHSSSRSLFILRNFLNQSWTTVSEPKASLIFRAASVASGLISYKKIVQIYFFAGFNLIGKIKCQFSQGYPFKWYMPYNIYKKIDFNIKLQNSKM